MPHKSVQLMKKTLLIILLATCWTAILPVCAEIPVDEIEQIVPVRIVVKETTVKIVGGEDMTLEVFNVTGAKVLTRQIDSNDKTFTLDLPKGCYLFKVGKTVRKISIQ